MAHHPGQRSRDPGHSYTSPWHGRSREGFRTGDACQQSSSPAGGPRPWSMSRAMTGWPPAEAPALLGETTLEWKGGTSSYLPHQRALRRAGRSGAGDGCQRCRIHSSIFSSCNSPVNTSIVESMCSEWCTRVIVSGGEGACSQASSEIIGLVPSMSDFWAMPAQSWLQ